MCSRNDQCAFWENESTLAGIKLYPVMSLVGSWWWSLRAVLDMANKRIYNTLLCACISKLWCCKCSIVMIWNARRNYEKAHVSDHALMQVREKQLILWAETFSRSSKIKKCVSLLAVLITSETRQFHWKLLYMVTPNMWFWQQVQGPRSWRIRRRNGVGSLEVNNQFFTLIWVHLKIFVRTLLLYFCYSALDCTSTTFWRWEHAA